MSRRRLIMLLALAACRPGARRTNPVDDRLAGYMPGVQLLAGARLDQLPAAYTAALRKLTGSHLEPREVLAGWDGQEWLIALRGDRGGPLPPSSGRLAFAAPERDVTLAGGKTILRTALARGRTRPADLLARAEALPAGTQAWAVSSGPVALGDLFAPAITRILQAVEDVTFAADLRSGIKAVATGNCLDERNARFLQATLRGMAAAARLPGIRITQQGRSLRLEADLPGDVVERLLQSAP